MLFGTLAIVLTINSQPALSDGINTVITDKKTGKIVETTTMHSGTHQLPPSDYTVCSTKGSITRCRDATVTGGKTTTLPIELSQSSKTGKTLC